MHDKTLKYYIIKSNKKRTNAHKLYAINSGHDGKIFNY